MIFFFLSPFIKPVNPVAFPPQTHVVSVNLLKSAIRPLPMDDQSCAPTREQVRSFVVLPTRITVKGTVIAS